MRLKSSKTKLKDLICQNYMVQKIKKGGPLCWICGKNPAKLPYHIFSKKDGLAYYLFIDNVVPGCVSCNGKEYFYRMRGRLAAIEEIHEKALGVEYLDRLKIKLRSLRQAVLKKIQITEIPTTEKQMREFLANQRSSMAASGMVPY